MLVVFFLLLLSAKLINGNPTLAYPFNSQVPPVARTNVEYNYTFPSNTFANYETSVIYSLSNGPSWLSIDSDSRRLHGTPSTEDAGNISFELVATDNSGSASDPVVLVVSSKPGPYLAVPLETQLQAMGSINGLGALILMPNTAFTLRFSEDTFAETGGNLSAYYGTSDNYTPLPSWISFDASSITFTGTTPSLSYTTTDPEYFEFVLIGTDYPGFAGISASFQVVIGHHSLTFKNDSFHTTASIGLPYRFQLPLSTLNLDSHPINSDNISTISANLTSSWLDFDNTTYTLYGTPEANAQTEVITLSVTDIYGDLATTIVDVVLNSTDLNSTASTNTSVTSSAQILNGSLPANFNVTAGTFFSYTFNQSSVPSSVSISVIITGASWLHYNPANDTLYGEVPAFANNVKRQAATASSVTVTVSDNGQNQSQTVGINVLPATATSPSTPSASSSSTNVVSSPAAASTAATTINHGGKSGQKSSLALGLGLGLGLGIVALIGLFVSLCYCRSRRRDGAFKKTATSSHMPEKEEAADWPTPRSTDQILDEPRQLGAFQMFKSTSEGRLSGYAVEVNPSGVSMPPLVHLAHELPPLPESPGFEAVRSAYKLDEDRSSSGLNATTYSRNSEDCTLLCGQTTAGVRNHAENIPTIKPVVYSRRSTLGREVTQRESTHTIDSVVTDELFSVRLTGSTLESTPFVPLHGHNGPLPPTSTASQQLILQRRPSVLVTTTKASAQTLGTYTSSEEGGYIQRFGSQGESVSSAAHSQSLFQTSRNDISEPQLWRVIHSEDSFDSFGSYATTESHLSDELSFDESLSRENSDRLYDTADLAIGSDRGRQVVCNSSEEARKDGASRPGSEEQLAAPLSPDWLSTSRQASVNRRPTLNERVASLGKGNLRDFTAARRPMSSASVDRSADTTESSAEIAFI